MSRNLHNIILIASLTFNVAVIGLLGYTLISGRNPFFGPGRKLHRNEKLFANKEMRPLMDAMHQRIRETQPLREQSRKDREEFMKTLRSESFQPSVADSALARFLGSRAQIESKMGRDLIEMRKGMTAQQAKTFFDKRNHAGINPEMGGFRGRGAHDEFGADSMYGPGHMRGRGERWKERRVGDDD